MGDADDRSEELADDDGPKTLPPWVVGLIALILIAGVIAASSAFVSNQGGKEHNFTPPDENNDGEDEPAEINDSERPLVVLYTSMGDITVELYEDEAPLSVRAFVELVEQGFYDGVRFHRVINGFMIQGGDPKSKDLALRNQWGTGDPGYAWRDEPNGDRKFDRAGLLAMANNGPNTNGSQFFITLGAAPQLDDGGPMNNTGAHHNIFGEVASGMEVVESIGRVPTNQRNQPNMDVVIDSVEMTRLRDHPYALEPHEKLPR